MATEIQLKRGTTAELSASNNVLAEGEVGLIIDGSGVWSGNIVVGDGTTAANALTVHNLISGGSGGGDLSQSDIDTLAKINAIITDATLVSQSDITNQIDSATPDATNLVAGLMTLSNDVSDSGTDGTFTKDEIKASFLRSSGSVNLSGQLNIFTPSDSFLSINPTGIAAGLLIGEANTKTDVGYSQLLGSVGTSPTTGYAGILIDLEGDTSIASINSLSGGLYIVDTRTIKKGIEYGSSDYSGFTEDTAPPIGHIRSLINNITGTLSNLATTVQTSLVDAINEIITNFRTADDEDKRINTVLRFIDVEPFELSTTSDFRVDNTTVDPARTLTIKQSDGTTDYVLGTTVSAFDYLIFTVDSPTTVKVQGTEI